MKSFTIIMVMFFIKDTMQQPSSSETLLEMARSSVVDCYEDEANTKKIEVTEVGFHDILKGSRNAVRNAKCIRYCIMKKHNMFSTDNRLDETEVIPFFAYLFNNKIDAEHMKKIISKCNDEIFGELDRCERSHKATMCILQQLQEGELKDI